MSEDDDQLFGCFFIFVAAMITIIVLCGIALVWAGIHIALKNWG